MTASPSDPLSFAQVLASRQTHGAEASYQLTADWGQGRATFGGLISALAVDAMRATVGAAWPSGEQGLRLKALQTNFVGPAGPGRLQVEVRLLREGKNVRQVQATAMQDGQVAGVFLGVFGARRQTSLPTLLPERPLQADALQAAQALPFIPGLTPEFTQHFDFRWAEGSLPFTGGEHWHSAIYLRLKAGELAEHPWRNELLTVMFSDAGPTPALGRLKGFAPASSVSWALELRVPDARADESGWWRADKETAAAAHGYVNERSTLWAPDGSLASLGYQVVGVYG